MKLEDQVCSLELSQKLNKLGVKQESLFYYFEDKVDAHAHHALKNRLYLSSEEENPPDQKYASAFTTAELGELLPPTIIDDEDGETLYLYIYPDYTKQTWFVAYRREYHNYEWETVFVQAGNSLVGAMAKMIIYLIENNLINLYEINRIN